MKLLLRVLLLPACLALAETTVFENFTLIDGQGGAAKPKSALVAVDGRIQWVGPQAQLKAPAGARKVDLTGKYLMPGIVNLHGHVGNTVDLAQDPKNFTRDNVSQQLKMYAQFGVTTVCSMGSEQDLILQMRTEQRAGRPSVARIFTARRGFTGQAGYPTTAPGMKGVPYEVSSVAQVEKNVAELADKKVDIVKIWVDDHLGKEVKIPLDLAKAIIANGHKRNLKVAAHIFYLDDAKKLVDAGLDGLAHSVRDKPVDKELIDLMKRKGAWLSSATLTRELSTYAFAKPHAMLSDPLFARAVSPAVLQTLRSPEFQKRAQGEPDTAHGADWLSMAQKNLKTLADAGVKCGFGTDTGPPRRIQGYFEHLEMELMAEAGLKPAQILSMATRNSAEFLGVSKDLGTVEAGKWADLVALARNPLDDIKNTRSIEAVWIAGNKVQ
ncbi:MAG: amidohydrolase family protein [Acidobacteria bacterium]|nr:amidohydrolase family protein [Acidobacteriota bacterium]